MHKISLATRFNPYFGLMDCFIGTNSVRKSFVHLGFVFTDIVSLLTFAGYPTPFLKFLILVSLLFIVLFYTNITMATFA